MTHFLARLVDRTRTTASRVEPLIRSQFAPGAEFERASEIEAPRPAGTEPKSASEVPHDAGVRSSGDRGTPPPAAGETDTMPGEEIPLLVSHRSTPQEADKSSKLHPRIAAGDTSVGRTPAASPRKSGRAIVAAEPQQRKHRGDPSSVISNDDEPDRPPVVRVTIGRIDVRTSPAPVSPQRKPPVGPKPALALDEYLKSRKEGAR